MRRFRPAIFASIFSLPLLVGLIVLAVNGGARVATADLGSQDCLSNTAGNASVTFEPPSANVGDQVTMHLTLSGDTPVPSDREVEVIWDSELPNPGLLVGEGYIPETQSAADVSFTVPQGMSGFHDVAVCWDFNADGGWRNVEVSYYAEPTIQCVSPSPTDAELTADSPVAAGGSGTASLTGIPVNPDQDQYLQIILDRTGPDPLLVGENVIPADGSNIDTSFFLPSDTPPGTHTLTACWYWGDGWYAATVDIEVTRPQVFSTCGFGGPLAEYDAANVTFTPTDPGADDDFTAHISNVIQDEFQNQYTEFLWNWDHVPNDSLVTNGTGHIPQGSSSGDVDGWIPLEPQAGDVLTICWFHAEEVEFCEGNFCVYSGTWYYKDIVWPFAETATCMTTADLTDGITPADLANALAGTGVAVSNVTYSGAAWAAGTFEDNCPVIGFDSGVILSSGDIANVVGPNTEDSVTAINDTPGDDDLSALSGFETLDAAALEFDFVPDSSLVRFSYVFGSDEYNEYVGSEFNDVFAFFVNGTNCATVGGLPVSINTINGGNPYGSEPSSRPELYRNNDPSDPSAMLDTEMDGLTVVLTCEAAVAQGQTNHIKLAIADASDSSFDSDVFLRAESFVAATATPTATASPTPTNPPTGGATPGVRTPRVPTPTEPSLTNPPTEPATEPPTQPPTQAPTPTPTLTATPVVTPTPTAPPTATPIVTAPVTLGPPLTFTPVVTAPPTPVVTTAPATAPPTAAPTTAPATDSPTPTPSSTAISSSQGPVFPTAVGGVGVTPTPTRSPTPTPTPTRATATRTPNGSPTPTALGEQETPQPNEEGDGSGIPIDSGGGKARPDWVRPLPTIGNVNGDMDVILTNIALGGFSLMLLFLSAEIFNQTVEENEEDIKRTARKYAGPVVAVGEAIGGVWDSLFGHRHLLATLAAAPIILLLAALIYIFQEPGFGMNDQTLVLLVSLLISVGFLTYAFDGLQVLLAKSQGVNAVLRLFPVGIFLAAFCVAFTRLGGIHPGLIYGFIAASVVVGERKLTKEQEGLNVFVPAMLLLLISVGAWLLLDPLRNLAEDNDSWIAAVPEAVAVGIFVGAVSSIFMQNIPMRFMDGYKLIQWSKLAWALQAGLAAFLFWHVMINTNRSDFNAVGETAPAVAIIAMASCFLATIALYTFFRFRQAMAGQAA